MARTPTTPQPRVNPSTPRRSAPPGPPAPRPTGEAPRTNGYGNPAGPGPAPQAPPPPVRAPLDQLTPQNDGQEVSVTSASTIPPRPGTTPFALLIRALLMLLGVGALVAYFVLPTGLPEEAAIAVLAEARLRTTQQGTALSR